MPLSAGTRLGAGAAFNHPPYLLEYIEGVPVGLRNTGGQAVPGADEIEQLHCVATRAGQRFLMVPMVVVNWLALLTKK